ncbi:MAG: quinoprotein relay system zinc metallohydrolase 1 [Neptuniibacter sp.]
MMKRFLSALLLLTSLPLFAETNSYNLKPVKIANNSYVLFGENEEINNRNGGHIANTSFITTKECTLVFDTGSSVKFAREVIYHIRSISEKPICKVINSHFHPDHFLGNAAFTGAKIISLKLTSEQIKKYAEHYRDNFYKVLGDWMHETQITVPTPLTETEFSLGEHNFRLIKFEGHSGADLVLHDLTTNTLFAGDLLFHQRAASTAHSKDIKTWLKDLDALAEIGATTIVPGHGPLSDGSAAIQDTKTYLTWLDQLLTDEASSGADITEVINAQIPESINNRALVSYELSRSATHLFHHYEEQYFD